jgi:phosphopentomutase
MVAKEQTKPGDPEYDTYKNIAQWNNTMECVPDWDEILEYEYVRQRGEINMITENVQRYAYDRGLYACVTWLQRCKDAHVGHWKIYAPSIKMHEKEHGPARTWITDDIKEEFLSRELDTKEFELQQQLATLRARRENKKVKK